MGCTGRDHPFILFNRYSQFDINLVENYICFGINKQLELNACMLAPAPLKENYKHSSVYSSITHLNLSHIGEIVKNICWSNLFESCQERVYRFGGFTVVVGRVVILGDQLLDRNGGLLAQMVDLVRVSILRVHPQRY